MLEGAVDQIPVVSHCMPGQLLRELWGGEGRGGEGRGGEGRGGEGRGGGGEGRGGRGGEGRGGEGAGESQILLLFAHLHSVFT